KELEDGITSLLRSVNMKMSTYIPDSEISLFNNFKKNSWLDISPETAFVLSNALRISEMTGGAFDITIGPLINLWGFGPDRKPIKIPEDTEINQVRGKIGYKKISVRSNPPSARKDYSEVYCDLSAIAKGYGVDIVASFLDSQGFYNYLVEIGGEISVRGENAGGKEWRLGVLAPDGSNDVKEIISIGDLAMATSGDYHNYFEENGIRYSHTIDPVTGRPITHKLVSVTVIMKSCMEADALATAINVMGPVRGYEFAVKNSIPVYMIVKEGEGYKDKMSPSFSDFPVDNRKN
ncbi:MAG: FAD:protein FMN transferase, partial [Candidatus Aminicenantes bacterium]|nr:FAD:protein FMN transferase [Candidatus Aminicenantes bacterium]